MSQPEAEPTFPIPAVYLIHGKGESSEGTVKKLQAVLEQHWPGLNFVRPDIPYFDPKRPADVAVKELLRMPMPQGSLLVGVGLGGLVAARLQELGRQDLQVIAISSPTWADEVTLESWAERRLAFYSSQDPIIGSRIANWPELASFSQDLDWLDQETDQHLRYVARLFDWYLEGTLPKWIHNIRKSAATKQERDEIAWNWMAQFQGTSEDWGNSGWRGGRPRDFAEVGEAIHAGRSWDLAWGDWLHEFVYWKDARCLAAEPPSWFSKERRAMMAGVAEFFAGLYELPKPVWVDKPEYFLAVMEYQAYLATEPNDRHFMPWPPLSEAALYRMKARSPKEMLRRHVAFEARNLTVL
jgi:pimeloyl-ACP methyl ester carboxylesterase